MYIKETLGRFTISTLPGLRSRETEEDAIYLHPDMRLHRWLCSDFQRLKQTPANFLDVYPGYYATREAAQETLDRFLAKERERLRQFNEFRGASSALRS